MIDLHVHTTYSDGFYNVENLIKIAKEKGIKYLSITDHNAIDAHAEIRKNNLQERYGIKILPGSEIQVNADKYVVEVLVYNFDLTKFKTYMEENKRRFWSFHHEAYKHFLEVATSMGLKYKEPKRELENGYYANMRFQDAIKAYYDENIKIVDSKILNDQIYFYRREMLNPSSPFFVDTSKAFPNINDLIGIVHDCGGLCFLAHLDEYQAIEDKMVFLNYLVNNTEIDGIECFHPSINEFNRQKYLDFAHKHNLLVSAGSDFHGLHKENRKQLTTPATLDDISWLKNLTIK